MTDLDTTALRKALRAPGDPGDLVDVTQLMARGRRLRARRRLAAAAGALCAVAALAGTATAIGNLAAAPSAPGQPAAPRHDLGHVDRVAGVTDVAGGPERLAEGGGVEVGHGRSLPIGSAGIASSARTRSLASARELVDLTVPTVTPRSLATAASGRSKR